MSHADSSDIVDHKLKLILGLIWTLVLHYSISMPVWDDDENRSKLPEQTPKQRLLGWVQNKLPDRPVTNFTTDWNDGRAIGALVDGIAPGRERENRLNPSEEKGTQQAGSDAVRNRGLIYTQHIPLDTLPVLALHSNYQGSRPPRRVCRTVSIHKRSQFAFCAGMAEQ